VYVTDTVKYIAETAAQIGGGSYTQKRYYDFIHPKPEETRTADEIIEQISKKLDKIGGE
jgi:hypothetical protein